MEMDDLGTPILGNLHMGSKVVNRVSAIMHKVH